MNEREKYDMLWAREEGYGNDYARPRGRELIQYVLTALGLGANESIIDIGGGDGRLKEFFRGHEYTSLDIAPNSGADIIADISEWKDQAFDVGICFDVMEHLPTERVDAAIDNIADICDECVFMICVRPDRFGKKIGMPLHLTVKPTKWWFKKLETRWKLTQIWRANKDYCVIYAGN